MGTWINVARLTKAKTLEGGLLAQSAKGLPFLLEEGMEVVFVPPVLHLARHARVSSVRGEDSASRLVFFDTIPSIDQAEQLVGHYCLVRRDALDEEKLVPSTPDYKGYRVLDGCAGDIGSVIRIDENPAYPFLVVDVQGREVLVPVVDEIVRAIDDYGRTITVSLPDGLLDL